MIIKIKVKTNSDNQELTKISDREYQANLKQKPVDNKANLELIKLLKKELKNKINFKDINIIKGKKSKEKIVELII